MHARHCSARCVSNEAPPNHFEGTSARRVPGGGGMDPPNWASHWPRNHWATRVARKRWGYWAPAWPAPPMVVPSPKHDSPICTPST